MPLDNVHVEVEDRAVRISWSDCSHIVEAMRSYRTTFKCVSRRGGSVERKTNIDTQRYIPEDRNRIFEFEFKDVSSYSTCPVWNYHSDHHAVIQGVVDVLLYPTLEHSHYEQHPVVTPNSTIETLRVYKHRTGANSADTCLEKKHPRFAILVSSHAAESIRSSKLYFDRPYLDLQRDKVQNLLIFKEIRCLRYMSSLEKYSEKDVLRQLDPEGGPDEWDWTTEDLGLSPINHEGMQKLHLSRHVDGPETEHYYPRSHIAKFDDGAYGLAISVQKGCLECCSQGA